MSDLDAIRAQRLAQLQAQQRGGAGATPGFQLPPGMSPAQAGPGGGGNPEEDAAAKAQAAQQEEEMRRGMMGQLLESDARERCPYLNLLASSYSVTYSLDTTVVGATDRRSASAHGQIWTAER
ncbi:hypothetical protein QFC21_004480 [Naganishia friedmannii]|uniref:Uncharacterized protein n=1 Tax=Naganishia friedmannii TaxID=89922 RepID=A0ACC2VGE3_9TREE|nr:hypothetical protein QFC21_004480 [Naganishia friedmannii]